MRNNRYEETYLDDTEEPGKEYEVIYEVTPYVPERGPTYACAGEPAQEREIIIIKIIPEPTDILQQQIQSWLEENHDYSED